MRRRPTARRGAPGRAEWCRGALRVIVPRPTERPGWRSRCDRCRREWRSRPKRSAPGSESALRSVEALRAAGARPAAGPRPPRRRSRDVPFRWPTAWSPTRPRHSRPGFRGTSSSSGAEGARPLRVDDQPPGQECAHGFGILRAERQRRHPDVERAQLVWQPGGKLRAPAADAQHDAFALEPDLLGQRQAQGRLVDIAGLMADKPGIRTQRHEGDAVHFEGVSDLACRDRLERDFRPQCPRHRAPDATHQGQVA